MRKGCDGGETMTGKINKKVTFLVATNVVASRLPQCRPTGMPIARANTGEGKKKLQQGSKEVIKQVSKEGRKHERK